MGDLDEPNRQLNILRRQLGAAAKGMQTMSEENTRLRTRVEELECAHRAALALEDMAREHAEAERDRLAVENAGFLLYETVSGDVNHGDLEPRTRLMLAAYARAKHSDLECAECEDGGGCDVWTGLVWDYRVALEAAKPSAPV